MGLLGATHLVHVTEDELARLQGHFVWIRSRNAAALDRRMADAVSKSEGFFFVRERMAILTPDRRDPGHPLVRPSSLLERLFEVLRVGRDGDQHDMHVRSPERLLPM